MGGVGKVRWGTGAEYSFLTVAMLCLLMIAIGLELLRRAIAVRKLSESAASCAALFPLWWGGGLCVFLLRMAKASMKRYSMFPDWRLSSRSRISDRREVLSRLCTFVGAKTNNSRWKRSHQKGADESVVWE